MSREWTRKTIIFFNYCVVDKCRRSLLWSWFFSFLWTRFHLVIISSLYIFILHKEKEKRLVNSLGSELCGHVSRSVLGKIRGASLLDYLAATRL